MKSKICTLISTVMMFVPWTIFLLRANRWALESPAAEIIVVSYVALMVFSGIFTVLCYAKGAVKNKLMQVCTAVNGIYAVVGAGLGIWMAYTVWM